MIAKLNVCCMKLEVFLSLCFHVDGGHTSGTAVLWFQILFDVDYLDQAKHVEMV